MHPRASNESQEFKTLYPPATGGNGFSAFCSPYDPHRYLPIISYDLDYTADRHVDLQLKNLLLPTPSLDALSEFEEREIKEPSARKVLNDHIIYMSSRFPTGAGLPLLSDFREAQFSDQENNADIMPNPYTAPEVILKSK